LPLIGSVLDVWRDPVALLCQAHREHGDFARMRFGPFDYFMVNDAEALQHVLVQGAKRYVKSRSYAGIKLVLGQGLLTSEGEFWKRQRRLAQPAFHHQRLRGFADTMASCTSDMLPRWDSLAASGEVFDLHAEMMRLTFRIVGLTLFSTDVEGDAQAVGNALGVALDFANEYVNEVVRLPIWLPTPRNVRFRRALATLDQLVFRLIDEHRRGPERGDLLAMLMQATDESGQERMNDRQLRDEVMTLVLAGHETTANALGWTWRLLAEHPQVLARLRTEADSVLGDRAPRIEDVPKLEYAERVLNESMRLYPPAWCFERQAIAPDEVGGYLVPPGAVVIACPYVLHRSPRYWPDPERFDPERFLPDEVASRRRGVYLPFGDGPRACIGRGFAMMEAKIILAMTAQRYDLALEPGHPIELEPGITLRPRHGLRARVRRAAAARDCTQAA
jgi:cytochrome P450